MMKIELNNKIDELNKELNIKRQKYNKQMQKNNNK